MDAVKLLLENGANINLQTPASGRTPLYVTAISKNIDTAKVLMKAGEVVGAAPVSRKWKLENKVLILDNIIRLKKVK